jgi:hypothetical protein
MKKYFFSFGLLLTRKSFWKLQLSLELELNRKIALSFDCDKRYISKNSVDKTLTWGHKDVTLNEKIMYCVLYSITIYTISTCNSMRCAKEF